VLSALVGGSNPPYPLKTRPLTSGTTVSFTLQGGSAAYLRLAVAGGTRGDIASTSIGGPVPPTVSVTLVRTR
jgi:hypothetical protein